MTLLPKTSSLAAGLLACAALAAAPSAASAASTCTVDGLNRMVVVDGTTNGTGPESELTITRIGDHLAYRDGLGPTLFCANSAVFAKTTTVSQIIVRAPAAPFNGITYDQTAGMLAPGNAIEADGLSEIEMLVDGVARVTVRGTPGADTMKATAGEGVMLGTDADVDVRARNSAIIIEGSRGNDFLSGRGDLPATQQGITSRLVLFGGAGNDTLVDGFGHDSLLGGAGDDTLFSVDGGLDVVQGDAGFDRGTLDTFDAPQDVLEQRFLGQVGKLRLAPAVVKAKAGGVARLRMSWTHPKAWKQLRRIAVRLYDGSTLVRRAVVIPRRAEHHGRTVSAELAFRLPKTLAGHSLRVDVEATDRNGRRQLEPGAGLVNL